MVTLKEVLQENVRQGAHELYETLDRGFVQCFACGHCCRIPDGQLGVCKVRYNRQGKLYVPGATLVACNVTRLKRSRSITLIRGRWPIASECWDAICTAGIA